MSARGGAESLRRALHAHELGELAEPLLQCARAKPPHGDAQKWRGVPAELQALGVTATATDFTRAAVRIGGARDCGAKTRARIKELLLQLQPWRKGPFEFFGAHIDAEWRADKKWARLENEIDLRGKRVLDIGCGNGYYLWRMLGAGAVFALGIDPAPLFIAQFNALKQFCAHAPAFALPLACEEFPRGESPPGFDCVFSMGVLSHRREPQAHLREALQCARPGGALLLETLVVEDSAPRIFTPRGRYAKMRNVWMLPSPPQLQLWLREAGAVDIRLLDVSRTAPDEQRATEWMRFESLADFLDARDRSKTIEGHPAPCRAMFLCARAA